MDASATESRHCGTCGRGLRWFQAGTWVAGELLCRRCRRAAARSPLTRAELWSWVRYELLVWGLVAIVAGGMAVALHGSVHIGGNPGTYEDPMGFAYPGKVTAWQPGYNAMGGYITNKDTLDCPMVTLWVNSGDTSGWIRVGPVAKGERRAWAGYRFDMRGKPAPLPQSPDPDYTFVCNWPLPPSSS